MKRLSKWTTTALLLLLLCGGASCGESYYVTEQPVAPVYQRPAAPYPGAVWIEGEWVWNNGRYNYRHGHWDRPHPRRHYVPGRWSHTPRGYRWHRGRWSR